MASDPGVSTSYPGLGSPPGAGALPVHLMPEELLQVWSSLPSDHAISSPITKQDLDNLFFSVSNAIVALDTTNRAFIKWSNGQVLDAQGGLEESRKNLAAGMSCLRYFFEGVISREVGKLRDG